MNTAQVSIELILAGSLALCAFVLPFWKGQSINPELLQSEALIGFLGLAYLLGVVFDKLADTMLTPAEHFLRIKQGAKFLDDHNNFKGKDPFPQNDLEFSLKKAKDGRLEWMNSLKSRIRTSRELAVLGLPAVMGLTIYEGVTRTCEPNQPACVAWWVYLPVVLNLLLFMAMIWLESRTSDEDSSEKAKQANLKTNQLSRDREIRELQVRQMRRQTQNASIPYYLLLANSIVTTGVIAMFNLNNQIIILLAVGGTLISLLALWSCLRITRTYLKFVAREMASTLKK
ncbi:MAG TPA: hypothetical protein PKK96_15060 [Anaerolineales bacterium]|nr:hypothetical protein [Anaerolineales bacterium]HNQ94946.1 hypothetical protein [Anaerolineales bacterium]HNS62320.1 hypothetical protein [Anaerolineales bacterium]